MSYRSVEKFIGAKDGNPTKEWGEMEGGYLYS